MQLQLLKSATSGSTRHDRMGGRDYLVVPMVMITEGVHNGNHGPLLYPAAELKKSAPVWNHKPIVVYHPTEGSACDPLVIETRGVGVVMNTKYQKGKLHAEAWLEVARLQAIDERIIEAIEKDEIMEVSTGLLTDNEEKAGVWNGEEYEAVARNYGPDHLAILPDMKGACSVADGAGLMRLNSHGKAMPRHLLQDAVTAMMATFTENSELSFSAVNSVVAAAIRESLGEKNWNGWIEDMYVEYAVYWNDGKLYRQDYHIKDNKASLVGAPVEVVRVIDYETVEATTANTSATATGVEVMTKTEIINGLIANSGWTEEDRTVLNTMSDAQLARLAKPAPAATTPAPVAPVVPAAPVAPAPAPVTNAAPAKQLSFEELLESAPVQLREVINEGLAANASERAQLITTITANAANVFTAEQLGTKATSELRSIAALARAPKVDYNTLRTPNYNGAAGAVPVVANNHTEEALALPTMDFSK